MQSVTSDRADLLIRMDAVKKWFDSRNLYYYGVFVKAFFPDFYDYTKLKNVWAMRDTDEGITSMMEKVILKIEKEIEKGEL